MFSRKRRFSSAAAHRSRSHRSQTRRLTLQSLERRQLLAVYTVDTLVDELDGNYAAGDLSFREAIELSNAGGTDTIQFAPGLHGTIGMLGYPLSDFQIDDDTAILGPGADRLTINGQGHQMFEARSPGITISGLTITGGAAQGGGAINVTQNADLLLKNAIVTGNIATASSGGAISVFQGKLTVVNSTISNNSAAGGGGGIQFVNGVDPDPDNPKLLIINTTISGNSAGLDGGGVNIYNDVARIINSTITGNRADAVDSGVRHGGGIYTFSADALVTLDNTIVANNTNSDGGNQNDLHTRAAPLVAASSHNLVGNAGSAGGLIDGVNGNIVGNAGAGTINISTVLNTTLANNGGATPTHALVTGSPALDAGNNAVVEDQQPLTGGRDQRAAPFLRIFDSDENGTQTVDIGAYEWQDWFKVDTLSALNDGNFDFGHLSLREAVAVAAKNPVAGEEIAFDPVLSGGVITLNGTQINVNTPVVINGPGAKSLTVSGNDLSRVFLVSASGVVISGLKISGGNPGGTQVGGGVLIDHASATLYGVHVTGNQADKGGGVYVNVGSLNLLASTISDNEADAAGGGLGHNGINPHDLANPSLRVIDSTISGNHANTDGGGAYIYNGAARFVNSTVTGNRANNDLIATASGGGIWTWPDALTSTTLMNTIVAGNEVGAGSVFVADDIGSEALEAASSHNLIGNAATAGGLVDGSSGNIVGNAGSGTIAISSVLNTTLKDNGFTPTHALAVGSPALDAASNALALDHEGNQLLIDGRGFERYADGDHDGVDVADMGAFEVQPPRLILSGTIPYTENASPVRLAPSATLSDDDNTRFGGGVLQVQVTTNAQPADRLRIRSEGTAAGQISVSGSTIFYGGIPIALFSGGDAGTPLLVQLGSNSITAATQAIVRNVTFHTIGDAPVTLPRTVEFTLSDGLGGVSAVSTKTVNVLAVNDAPILNNSLSPTLTTIAEDAVSPASTVVSSLLAGAVTDPDGSALRGIAVTAAAELNGNWEYTLNNGATWVDMGAVSSTAARLLPGWARVRFTPNHDYNGTVRLYYYAWDQTAGTAGGNLNMTGNTGGTKSCSTAYENAALTITAVNDKPVLTLSGTIGYVHDAAAITLAPGAGVSDVDSAKNFSGGRLRVRITDGASASNRLAIGAGFTVDASNNVLQGALIIGKRMADGVGTHELIITFNASVTPAIAQQLARAITFKTVGGAAGLRRVVFTVSDGDGGVSDEATKSVNVT